VYTFGENRFGQLCLGHINSSYDEPRLCINIMNKKCVQISLGGQHGLAVTDKGHVIAWGCNSNGQLASGDKKDHRSKSIGVTALKGRYIQVLAGFCHSMALSVSGSLFLWGDNIVTQLGMDISQISKTKRYLTTPVKNEFFGSSVVQVYTNCTSYHSFVKLCTGEMYAMGSNYNNQCFISHVKHLFEPIKVPEDDYHVLWRDMVIIQVATGSSITGLLLSKRTLLQVRLSSHLIAFSDIQFIYYR
jgi:alpha-tubulin suppressor-like RCC1 family protein